MKTIIDIAILLGFLIALCVCVYKAGWHTELLRRHALIPGMRSIRTIHIFFCLAYWGLAAICIVGFFWFAHAISLI